MMRPCEICGRMMCDHLPEERGISGAVMMGDIEPSPEKVLFLDVDGPLIPKRAIILHEKGDGSYKRFDPVAAEMISIILRELDVWIVLSSTWRARPLEDLEDIFRDNKVLAKFHPDWRTTVKHPKFSRREQILEWISRHPEVKSWAAVDDEDLSPLSNFVHVSYETALLGSASKS